MVESRRAGREAVGRRAFLRAGAAGTVLAWSSVIRAARRTTRVVQRTVPGADPFTLGVASGDPDAHSVVLWTRLAPEPLRGGGMTEDDVSVAWEVAADEGFRRVVQDGTVIARAGAAHAVHVTVEGLEPDRWYWYRFHVGSEESRVGRTRTLPAPGAAVDRLRFAFASCQHWEHGYFTAYDHMQREDLDLVLHLGDYIYEYEGAEGRVRRHLGGETELTREYRDRYALYRTDPDLQAVHAMFPFVVTWDDHEVDNNYASDVSEEVGLPSELLLRRRADAYRAYYEHMPLRAVSRPAGPRMSLYRGFDYGRLASFSVLDTRQFRSDQPCGDGVKPWCREADDPSLTMLGQAQERWLVQRLHESEAAWNVVPQQVMMARVARVDRDRGEEARYPMDQWAGYEASRRRLMEFLRDRRPANPLVLTGDIHTNWVTDLRVDYDDPSAPTVGTELVGTSISSGGDGSDTRTSTAALLDANPAVKLFNAQRGYVSCEVTPEACHAHFRVLDYVSRPGSPVRTRASFIVPAGRPGAVPA